MFRDVVHPLFHEVFVHPKVGEEAFPLTTRTSTEVLTRVLPEVFGYLDAVGRGPGFLAGDALSGGRPGGGFDLVNDAVHRVQLDRARFPRLGT